MMLHQDGSRHEWVPGKLWDLIVTMDDATSEHYSMFFVDEEGTQSSFQGIHEVISKHGVFASLYTDRGSHYWNTPEAGGKVDKSNLTQFGRAMRQLGIEMIPAYSPEARGRSERAFRTHQDRLVKELALPKSLTWKMPMPISETSTSLPLTKSLLCLRRRQPACSCHGVERQLRTSYANSMGVRSAMTTVFVSMD